MDAYCEQQKTRQLLSVFVQVSVDETPENVHERIVVNRGFIIHKGENNFIDMDAESIPDEFTNQQTFNPVYGDGESVDDDYDAILASQVTSADHSKRISTTSTAFESALDDVEELAVISEGNQHNTVLHLHLNQWITSRCDQRTHL